MTYPNKIPQIRKMFNSHLFRDMRPVINFVLDSDSFARCTGSLDNKHHFGNGGLQYHTWDVLRLCNQQMANYPEKTINKQVLFLAALYHDVGKIWDYQEYNGWHGTDHKRKIHHISRSAIEWNKAAKENCEECLVDEVTHCILAHHGQREWGSPVAPKTREAWILHISDQMSARVDDCDRIDLIK